MKLIELMQKRYATKKFDGETIPESKIEELKDLIKLVPSSFGLQPFKVKIISNKELKEKLAPASWNQTQITTCSHLLVFCAYTNIKERVNEYEQLLIKNGTPPEKAKAYTDTMRGFNEGLNTDSKNTWAQKQVYLAVENALLGATELGFDSCPMEGFIPADFSKILQLTEDLIPTVLVPIGYAADTPRTKIRFENKDLFF
ncbi:NAD(P)H-dependent oxidoreductase [Candidatus Woesearchaeota archaeon CG10_big_fil_rev_8_21_14_0_10_32_9]|nr:MAG: NAD(P)H-dependent oxidoreductase [Candidatus Woesearchaeota archaeon CG10_big_fil_rev_8_21_14_0_10_32_9]